MPDSATEPDTPPESGPERGSESTPPDKAGISPAPRVRTCWIVTEGMAGTENQCLGVAEALCTLGLPLETQIKRIALRQPWRALCPWLGFEQEWSFIPPLQKGAQKNGGSAWPDLLITAGRKSVAAARYVKKASGGRTLIVQIQDPRTHPAQFDLVAVPHHDRLRGPNVIVTDATPNRITPDNLAAARDRFAPLFAPLPAPRIAVLIGGASKTHSLPSGFAQKLAGDLSALDGGLMITASRRTGAETVADLKQNLRKTDIFFWDGLGDNPYSGMLAWADHILVTADSASMISDAATTGKPVYRIDLAGGSCRFNKLYAHLEHKGALKPFTGALDPADPADSADSVDSTGSTGSSDSSNSGGSGDAGPYTPLADAMTVANAIRDKLNERLGLYPQAQDQ